MSYVSPNFKTKKALKEALASGREVWVFEPGGLGPPRMDQRCGGVWLEGPHYPEPHTWYAEGTIVNGRLTKILK